MNNILNSDAVNFLIKFALSKSGFAVSAVVTWVIVHLGLPNIIPADALAHITAGLDAGGIAIISIFYAWITYRQNKGVKALQIAHNMTSSHSHVEVDGIAGNATVKAFLNARHVTVDDLKRGLAAPR